MESHVTADSPSSVEPATRTSEKRSTSHPASRRNKADGLPENLRTGIESLSGLNMEDVKVHYNSSHPAKMQAQAFAQGNQIHLGPGKERHLPHEVWHVVQQKQGRVKQTMQMKGHPVNDQPGLETEADQMGAKALQQPSGLMTRSLHNRPVGPEAPRQAVWIPEFLSNMLGLSEKEKEKSSITPMKASAKVKGGDTLKPPKIKEKDEIASTTLISGTETGKEKKPEKKVEKEEPKVLNSNVVDPHNKVDMGPMGMKPGKYTHPYPPPDMTPKEGGGIPISTSVKWGDVSIGSDKKEGEIKKLAEQTNQEKKAGDTYKLSLLKGTYTRDKLSGSGKDKSYKLGPSLGASGQVLHGKKKKERELVKDWVKGSVKGDVSLGSVEGNLDAGVKLDAEKKKQAKVGFSGNVGAYAAKGSAGGDIGFRIPMTNAMVSVGGKGEVAYGYGAGGEASLQASKEQGLKASLGAKLIAGFGGALGFNMGVSKYDPKKPWWGEKPDEEYLKNLPKKGTPNRWKGIPDDVKARYRAKMKKEERAKRRKKRK